MTEPAKKQKPPHNAKPAAAVADWLKSAKGVVGLLSEGEFLELAGARKPVEIAVNRKVKLPALAAAAETLRAAATAAVAPYLDDNSVFVCEVRFDNSGEIAVEFRSGGTLDITLHFPPVAPAVTPPATKSKPAKEAAAKA